MPLRPLLFLAAVAAGAAAESAAPPQKAEKSEPAASPPAAAAPAPSTGSGPSAFNREWTMADLLPAVENLGTGRDFRQGGRTFRDAGCGICHAFSTYFQGGGLAPDLTGVGSKYPRDFILQSILEPSASINGQFYATLFKLKGGRSIQGTIVGFENGTYKVVVSVANPDATIDIKEADVASQAESPVSPMPPGLLNGFTREQIIDLFAFLDSRGDSEADVFKPAK